MKNSNLIMLGGVGLLAYAVLKNNANAATPGTTATQTAAQQQAQMTANQTYINEGSTLLSNLFHLFQGGGSTMYPNVANVQSNQPNSNSLVYSNVPGLPNSLNYTNVPASQDPTSPNYVPNYGG